MTDVFIGDLPAATTVAPTDLLPLDQTAQTVRATVAQIRAIPADGLSGDAVHGGTISAFASTGIDDDATATVMTLTPEGRIGIGTPAPAHDLTLQYGGGGYRALLGLRAGDATNAHALTTGYNGAAAAGATPAYAFFLYTQKNGGFGPCGGLYIGGSAPESGPLALVTQGAVRVLISEGGVISLPEVGAGTLQTDAAGRISAMSDATVKDVTGDFTAGLAEIMALSPKTWRYTEDSGLDTEETYAGFIAQEVMAAGIPHAVFGPPGRHTLQVPPILAALVNAMKELSSALEAMDARVRTIEGTG